MCVGKHQASAVILAVGPVCISTRPADHPNLGTVSHLVLFIFNLSRLSPRPFASPDQRFFSLPYLRWSIDGLKGFTFVRPLTLVHQVTLHFVTHTILPINAR